MYKLYVYDVVKGYSRLIEDAVSVDDIEAIKHKYGSSSVIIDGTDILVLRMRL